jgi:hypothetical protein
MAGSVSRWSENSALLVRSLSEGGESRNRLTIMNFVEVPLRLTIATPMVDI